MLAKPSETARCRQRVRLIRKPWPRSWEYFVQVGEHRYGASGSSHLHVSESVEQSDVVAVTGATTAAASLVLGWH